MAHLREEAGSIVVYDDRENSINLTALVAGLVALAGATGLSTVGVTQIINLITNISNVTNVQQLTETVEQITNTIVNNATTVIGNALVLTKRSYTAADLTALVPQQFPITAIDHVAAKVTIAGDHRSLFPVGGAGAINGSTNNDGYQFGITAVDFVGGNTHVTFGQQQTSNIADGFLANFGSAGADFYTPTVDGEVVLAAFFSLTSAPVSSESNVGLHLGSAGLPDAIAEGSFSAGSDVDGLLGTSDMVKLQQGAPAFIVGPGGSSPVVLHANPVRLVVDDAFSGKNPGVTSMAVTAYLLTLIPS